MTIFAQRTIAITKTPGEDREPLISFDGAEALVINGVDCTEEPNFSLRTDLRGKHRYLSFNEKPVMLTIQGLVPPKDPCTDLHDMVLDKLNKIYEKHKVGKEPLTVAYEGNTYKVVIAKKLIKSSSRAENSFQISTFILQCVGQKV